MSVRRLLRDWGREVARQAVSFASDRIIELSVALEEDSIDLGPDPLEDLDELLGGRGATLSPPVRRPRLRAFPPYHDGISVVLTELGTGAQAVAIKGVEGGIGTPRTMLAPALPTGSPLRPVRLELLVHELDLLEAFDPVVLHLEFRGFPVPAGDTDDELRDEIRSRLMLTDPDKALYFVDLNDSWELPFLDPGEGGASITVRMSVEQVASLLVSVRVILEDDHTEDHYLEIP